MLDEDCCPSEGSVMNKQIRRAKYIFAKFGIRQKDYTRCEMNEDWLSVDLMDGVGDDAPE